MASQPSERNHMDRTDQSWLPSFLPKFLAWLLRTAAWIVWLWCLGALFYCPFLPRWLGAVAAIGYGFFALTQLRQLGRGWIATRNFTVVSLTVVLITCLPRPSHDREWSAQHAVMPTATVEGDRVTVHNLRRTTFGPDGEANVAHVDQAFNLSKLESLWFGVQQFSAIKGMAHTFVSFGFSNGNYLAISIESRRGEGEGFSPLAGLYRNFGMIYVIADEQEVIGQRTLASDDPLYLYRIRANPLQLRALLLSMLNRANQLSTRPEFYNTLTNNCTNNIVYHANQIAPEPLSPYSLRIAMPGYTGRVAYDHGLINSELPFAEVESMARINALADEAVDADDFSQVIRANWR